MKRKASTVILIFLISSFLLPLIVEAQPQPPFVATLGPIKSLYQRGNVIIFSPINATTNVNPIQLSFTLKANGLFGQFGNVGVSIDGGLINTVANFTNKTVIPTSPDYWFETTILANVTLRTLSEGNHNATVYYGWQYLGTPKTPSLRRYEVTDYLTVHFMVVDPSPLTILGLTLRNKTYTSQNIPLNFTVNKNVYWAEYNLDNKGNVTLQGNTTLTGLFDGPHKIVTYVRDTFGNTWTSEIVNFSVDTLSPVVTFLSPQNRTYNDANVILSVFLNEQTSNLNYSLDGLEPVAFSGNVSLSDFEYGMHNVTVYATDLVGHSSVSDTIYFSVEPFPTAIAVISLIIIIIVGAGIFINFKKHKGKNLK